MKKRSGKKYKILKIVTAIFSALLLILIILLISDLGSGLITHQDWAFYSFTISTLILSTLFSISWFVLVLVSFDKLRIRPEDLLSSRSIVAVYIILGIILLLLGLAVLAGDIFFMIIMLY